MFKSAYKVKLWLFILYFALIFQQLFAGKPTNITIESSTQTATPAIIGSELSIAVDFSSDEANNTAIIYTNGITRDSTKSMNIRGKGGKDYVAEITFRVEAGSINYKNTPNATVKISIGNASGSVDAGTVTFTVDNKVPEREGMISAVITRAGVPITGNIVQAGDLIVFTQNTKDDDTDRVSININGLGAQGQTEIVLSPDTTNKVWKNSSGFTVPPDITGNYRLPVTITDKSGQSVTYNDYTISIAAVDDGEAPVIDNTTIKLTPDNTTSVYKVSDTVSVEFDFTSNIAVTSGSINYNSISTILNFSKISPDRYKATGDFTILPGTTNYDGTNRNNGTIAIRVINAKGNDTKDIQITLDNKVPSKNGNMTITQIERNGETITGGGLTTVKPGDKISVQQTITDNDAESVTMDLSSLNLSSAEAMTDSGDGRTYTGTFTVPNPLPGTNFSIHLTITDKANQVKTENNVLNLTGMENGKIGAATVTSNAGAGNPSKPGHQLTFTLFLNNYDSQTVIVECSELKNKHGSCSSVFKNFPITLDHQETDAAKTARFQKTITLPKDQDCFYNVLEFNFKVREGSLGLQTTSRNISFTDIIDLGEFQHKSAKVEVYAENGSLTSPQIATSTSALKFISDVIPTAGEGGGAPETVTVTADLGPLNEPSLVLTYDTATKKYIGTYNGGFTKCQLDGQYVTFQVTAKDRYGEEIAKSTTPAILIDNVKPVITENTFTISSGTGVGGIIKYKDNITFKAVTTGATNGSAFIDLTPLDGSGIKKLTSSNGTNWQLKHTIGLGDIDDEYEFILVVRDAHGNETTAALTRVVDNEPPVYKSKTETKIKQQNPPYVIIGDRVTTTVELDKYNDIPTVQLDLTTLDGSKIYGIKDMVSDRLGNYSLSFDIATGSLNLGATFPVIITDDAGNSLIDNTGQFYNATFNFPTLDQNPPDPSDPTVQIINMNPRIPTDDELPNIINSWKKVIFTLPYSREAGFDDSATASVDITHLNKPDDIDYLDPSGLPYNVTLLPVGVKSELASMTKSFGNYTLTILATESPLITPVNVYYEFELVMSDVSGNKVAKKAPRVDKIDLVPPKITKCNVTGTPTGAGGAYKIGDKIEFTVEVTGNEDRVPTISGLSNITNDAYILKDQPMDLKSSGVYSYSVTITETTKPLNSENASWPIIVYDQSNNFDEIYTPEVKIDNKPLEIKSFTVTSKSITDNDRINYSDKEDVLFTVETTEEAGALSLDLSAIGITSVVTKDKFTEDTTSGYVYTYKVTPKTANASYTDYVFNLDVADAVGNTSSKESKAVPIVDCQVPAIKNSLSKISALSTSLPAPTDLSIARVGDTITISASVTAYIDATVETILEIDPGVASLTEEMIYNPNSNRHESTFIIEPNKGVNNWGNIDSEINYIITATDLAANVATPSAGITSFKVYNYVPEFEGFTLTINPDYAETGILSVASGGTYKEYLVASATLKDNRKIENAYIDFSAIKGAPSAFELASKTQNVANSKTGEIDLTAFPTDDFYDKPATVKIQVTDTAGYTISTTTNIKVDTKPIEIAGVYFNGNKHELSIRFTEDLKTGSFVPSQWTIIGSTTTGLTGEISLGNTTYVKNVSANSKSVDVILSIEGIAEYVKWKENKPIYLRAANSGTQAAVLDRASNWIKEVSAQPIKITDSTLSEDPKILDFVMHNDCTFNITFSQDMDKTTFVASQGVLFVDLPSGITEFNDVSYDSWYVFQKSDKFDWLNNKELKITLSDNGKEWIASNLTSNLSKKLKFAQYYGKKMVKSLFYKELETYTIAKPFVITDNRKPNEPILNVYSSPKPVINLGLGTITLEFNDKVKLFSDKFRTDNEKDPLMALPTPTEANGSKTHLNKISLFNLNNSTPISLTCEQIKPDQNDFASTTVCIKLTKDDINKIFDFYNSDETINWGLQIEKDAFYNMWSVGNTKYKPTSPGTVSVINAIPTDPAKLIACYVSDMPPTKEDVENFRFEFELAKSKAGAIELPFSTQVSPKASIWETSTSTKIADASITDTGWSSREVDGKTRTIVSFKLDSGFAKKVDGVKAELRLDNLSDIFGNTMPPIAADYVYDINNKSNTTASSPFVIDNVSPTITAITPSLIGLTKANTEFIKITFSESLDTNIRPTVRIATTTSSIDCSFVRWESSGSVAIYKNNQPITDTTPNGIWNYEVSKCQDLAGNSLADTKIETTIKSAIPVIERETLKLYTIRKYIDDKTVVVDKPFNFNASDYIKLGFKYQTAAIENTPHKVNFYDASGKLIGSSLITQSGVNGTATLDIADFTSIPAANSQINVKIIDVAGNETDILRTLTYYAKVPTVTGLNITGIASHTSSTYYYSPRIAENNMKFSATTSSYNDKLNLLLSHYPAPVPPIATMTLDSTQNGYSLNSEFGKELAESTYILNIADEAGNILTGKVPTFIQIDNTAPTVIKVVPGPTEQIGNSAAEETIFTVVFNELMDTTLQPNLSIATNTQRIAMSFVGWGSDGMTASFTNLEPITATMPAGLYQYLVSGAKDITGNEMFSTPATCTTTIWPAGPGISALTVYTMQPDISSEVLKNRSYNPAKYSTGFGTAAASVTIGLNYLNTPTYTPHKLIVYDEKGKEIIPLPLIVSGKIGTVTLPATAMTSAGLKDGVYSFKILDSLKNYFPDKGYLNEKFTIDTKEPSITSIDLNDGGFGQTKDGIRYYSPSVPATFSLITNETEDLVMLLTSSTATGSYIIPAAAGYNVSLDDKISPTWHNNDMTIFVADLAGNISKANNASITFKIDSVPPEVLLATAIDDADMPILKTGKEARFLVNFDSEMNTKIQPIVGLATDTGLGTTEIATLTFVSWKDDKTCIYTTNGVFDTLSYPPGNSTIVVKNARDLAGNLIAEGTYGMVEVISQSPDYYATLTSRQTKINDSVLTNKTFSTNAEPGIATITLLYKKGPFALDHEMQVFDSDGNQIATHTLTAGATTITVDNTFFGTKDVSSYMGTFTIKLKDSMGNISSKTETAPNAPFVINFDSIAPIVSTFNITGVSTASTDLLYYNPKLSGNITADIKLAQKENCRLIVYGVSSSPYEIIATRSYELNPTNLLSYGYNGNLSDIYGNELPEGSYKVQIVDDAGNIPANYKDLLVDKTAPAVLVATMTDQLYISSGNAGMATFTVQFNESLFDKGYQCLEIATTSYKIPCRFIKLETTAIASDTAVFETAVAVPNNILQGNYTYHIVGTDLTGNQVTTDFGSIYVKSAGPIVRSIKTFSYQTTTASDTLLSKNEYHYDDMFSFNVPPKAATMTINLAEKPDGDPSKIYLTFANTVKVGGIKKEIIVASHSLALSGLTATFTWDLSTAPSVATEAEYIVRVADANNDLSAYSYTWTVDNVAPTYNSITFNSGINFPGSGTVYINPYKHTEFEITFKGVNDHSPKLRVRNGISTDTYPLTALSSSNWKTSFRGKYSRTTGSSDNLMPDGIYQIGLVDKAGNEASSGTVDLYKLIIDTKSPVISTYTFSIGSVFVNDFCSPSTAKPLKVSMETTETLTATGACYLDIYDAGQVRINRLPLKQGVGSLEAEWNGNNASGEVVADGNYTFKTSDLCGNTSNSSATIRAITSGFQPMNPAVQINSNTIKLWFNHAIDPTSLTVSTITTTPALTITNIAVTDERALTFNADAMVHGMSYTINIDSGLKNIYGSDLGTGATASFIADVKGPSIVATNFDLVNKQNEVMIVFDQPIDKATAENPNSYVITDSAGNIISITAAILQSDGSTVMITITGTFIEKANYTIKAPGVKDLLGNGSCESALSGFGFKGRDITPPTFKISAFSNAANENDIIVVAVSDEELAKAPTLTIKHGTDKPKVLTMQKNNSNKLAFMVSASLKSSNGQTGILTVSGEDLNGNKGSGENSFTIATVSVNSSRKVSSADNQFNLAFDENSLKSETTVKIFQREIEKDTTASGTMRTSLQDEYSSMRGIRASVTTESESAANSELTPLTNAYEASISAKKMNKGVIASLKVPEIASSSTQGIGLFYQKNGSWNFVSSNITSANEIKARITSSKVFAIMRDSVSPKIKLDSSIDLTKAFESARPEFIGSVKDFGSGINPETVEVKVDGKTQSLALDEDGYFKFKPLSELTNGNHELSINASDKTGNTATTGSMRFSLVLPFEFKQIIQYPNPARKHTYIRIRTNSSGINCGIKARIFDVAGHKVADFNESDVIDKRDGSYEIRWDLTNLKGKKVANGTYLARIEAINPETGKKIKKTLKIAVLR